MGFPNFGKKNKDGKKDRPTKLKTNPIAKKLLHAKKPKQY